MVWTFGAAHQHPHFAKARLPEPKRQTAVHRQAHGFCKVVEEGVHAHQKGRAAVVGARRRTKGAGGRRWVAAVARDARKELALEL